MPFSKKYIFKIIIALLTIPNQIHCNPIDEKNGRQLDLLGFGAGFGVGTILGSLLFPVTTTTTTTTTATTTTRASGGLVANPATTARPGSPPVRPDQSQASTVFTSQPDCGISGNNIFSVKKFVLCFLSLFRAAIIITFTKKYYCCFFFNLGRNKY